MSIFDRLRKSIREVCETTEIRHEKIREVCRELQHDIAFYERLLRSRRGGGD